MDTIDNAKKESAPQSHTAVIHSPCVGCTKCVDVCPETAISGARRRLHLVNPALCTGCGDCVPVCPVDCITLDGYVPAKAAETAVPLGLPSAVQARIEAARAKNQQKWAGKEIPAPKELAKPK